MIGDRHSGAVAGILLIEDDTTSRQLLRTLLERDSHTVWEAASPDEGWAVIEERAAPELAIVDLRLGEATGIDFMRRLRDDAIWAALPVVLCSATPDRESVLNSMQLGAAAFLAKPYDALRIRAAVGKAMATKWVRRHFEEPGAVTRRLSTDRDLVAEQAKRFFAEVQLAARVVVETEEERTTAVVQVAALQRTAGELGLLSLKAALAEWEKAGGGRDAAPVLVQRVAVLARLYAVLGV